VTSKGDWEMTQTLSDVWQEHPCASSGFTEEKATEIARQIDTNFVVPL
jgi:hypothetical protein